MPILLSSGDNLTVFDAVIRLLVNLTVPVECLCSVEYLLSDQGRQTRFELTASLMRTKESFRDQRTTTMIMVMVERLIGQEKMTNIEVTKETNRGRLHLPSHT